MQTTEGTRMTILVAEDDKVSRLVLVTKLKKLGHEVIATDNGRSAWEAFTEAQPQMIITDWMMPEMDGLELCRLVRATERDAYVYIMLLTALIGKKNYLEGMAAGADDFLNKPVDMDELVARLRVAERILGMHKEIRQLEGLLPICAYCKKIRDDEDRWHPVESYISTRTDVSFSHGYCPECMEKYVKPQLEEMRRKSSD
jgi:sigma-B regulation protein RsbU (phosphoserine phosphatase)